MQKNTTQQKENPCEIILNQNVFKQNFIAKGSEMAVQNCAVFDVIDEKKTQNPQALETKPKCLREQKWNRNIWLKCYELRADLWQKWNNYPYSILGIKSIGYIQTNKNHTQTNYSKYHSKRIG